MEQLFDLEHGVEHSLVEIGYRIEHGVCGFYPCGEYHLSYTRKLSLEIVELLVVLLEERSMLSRGGE